MRGAASAWIAAAMLLGADRAGALEVERLETSYDAGVYRVWLLVRVDAPPGSVERVLEDFEAYGALDPRILSSERVGAEDDGAVLLRTRIRDCEGIFCRSVTRLERVRQGPGYLVATVIPEGSDLRSGSTRTEWGAEADGTRVSYVAEFEPDFWVPSVIARRFAGHGLRDSTLRLFENVEKRARER